MKDTFKLLFAIIRYTLWILVMALLAIVLVQRVSNNKQSIAGIRFFTVITESMMPKYKIGDTIIVKESKAAELGVGDDITYLGIEGNYADKYITHRIVKISEDKDGKYKLITQGIANPEPDPEIDESQVYGKVIYKTELISYLNGVMGNLYSMYFILVVPMAILMFFEIRAFGKKDEDKENDDEEIEEDDKKKEETKDKQDDDKARRERRKNRRHKRRKNRKG